MDQKKRKKKTEIKLPPIGIYGDFLGGYDKMINNSFGRMGFGATTGLSRMNFKTMDDLSSPIGPEGEKDANFLKKMYSITDPLATTNSQHHSLSPLNVCDLGKSILQQEKPMDNNDYSFTLKQQQEMMSSMYKDLYNMPTNIAAPIPISSSTALRSSDIIPHGSNMLSDSAKAYQQFQLQNNLDFTTNFHSESIDISNLLV